MLRVALAVFDKELRESLRDPHVLLVSLGFPLVLYPLLAWGAAQLALVELGRAEQESPHVAVVGPPALVRALAAPSTDEDDTLLPMQIEEAALPEEARARVAAGRLDALVQGAVRGPGLDVDIVFHGGKGRSRRARDRIAARMDDLRGERVADLARQSDVPLSTLTGWTIEVDNVSPDASVARNLVALALPGLMLLIVPIAAMYPAVEVIVAERERGTLETTLVTARSSFGVLLGKYLSVVALTVVAVGGNALAMTLTLLHLREVLAASSSLQLSFRPLSLLAAGSVVACTIMLVAAALVASVVPARSFKQGETIASFVAMLAFAALPFAAMEQLHLTPASALLPLANSVLAVRDGVDGQIDLGAAVLASAVNLSLAAGLLTIAGRLLGAERYLLGGMPHWLAMLLRAPETR